MVSAAEAHGDPPKTLAGTWFGIFYMLGDLKIFVNSNQTHFCIFMACSRS